jgi:hypothetical protein
VDLPQEGNRHGPNRTAPRFGGQPGVADRGRLLAEVEAELARALMDGPGLVVFQRAFTDLPVVDRATDAFHAMIADQRASGAIAGDHFAKPGANDRVWNAVEKLAVREPAVFADYHLGFQSNALAAQYPAGAQGVGGIRGGAAQRGRGVR